MDGVDTLFSTELASETFITFMKYEVPENAETNILSLC